MAVLETKIGVLAALAIALLILGFNFLKGNDIFSNTIDVYAEYDHINGIKVSNPVLYNGFSVGKVTALELTPRGSIIATFTLDGKVQIPDNSTAKITSLDLLGAKGIELVLGNSKTYILDGDTMSSGVELSLAESVNSQVLPVKAKAEKLLGTMDSILVSIQYILNPNFRNNIDKSFASIKRSIETLEVTASRVDTMVKFQSARLKAITTNVESITLNLKNNNQRISNILANAETISDSLAKANIVQTIEKANKALSDVSAITERINKGEGSIGLLLNDEKLYNNLNSSASDLDKLMIDIKQNPKRYVHFSIFGGGSKKEKAAKTE
jgi:phospholipid/cholesterol/gamma-HCH transport system substrate-binding protein